METRIIVVGIVCDRNKVLLGKKSKGRPPYPDVWHTMGGGTEDQSKSKKILERNNFDDPYFHDELRREIQ